MSHCFWTLTLNLIFQATQYIWWSFVPLFKVTVVGINILKHCMLLKESVYCFYFSVYSLVSAYWLYLRVQFLEVWVGFKAKPGGVLSFENRAVSLCSYKHGQWYRLSKGCNYRLSKGCLFFLVICLFSFGSSRVAPLICPWGLCCTQEAISALFCRMSLTCAALESEAHHLQSKHPFS